MFDNTYARLPEHFFVRQSPAPAPGPQLVLLNRGLAEQLGLDPAWLASDDGIAMLAGNRLPKSAEPLAMAYAGHQFGGWVPQLGDGRAILLGEIIDRDGNRIDLQLKGAGKTPFSRMGDGRATLGPVLREYIISDAMAGLGIPTTRALAAVTTGDQVMREVLLPGAVLARTARSHVRVGTFEFFASRQDNEALERLADYVIERHAPHLKDEPGRYLALYDHVISIQAELVARWMGVGFIHGVMNTDNMSIAGETIDYGPCAFVDNYHPQAVYSSIDHSGRYAFGNQAYIAQWNLSCLARAMLPILDPDREKAIEMAQASLDRYPQCFRNRWLDVMRPKLGLTEMLDDDVDLINGLLDTMAANNADFTMTFRNLGKCLASTPDADDHVRRLFDDPAAFDGWASVYRDRLKNEPPGDERRRDLMNRHNPAFIPRNHRVEEALEAAHEGNLKPTHDLLEVLKRPFDDNPDLARLMLPPKPHEVVQATFCGT